jgi:hypothetical protein
VLCFGSADSKGVTGVFCGSADSKRVRSGGAGDGTTDAKKRGKSSEMGRENALTARQHAAL